MTKVPVGEALCRLNATVDVEPDDIVETVVVIAKVVSADGTTMVVIGDCDGLTWYDQHSLVYLAGKILDGQSWHDGPVSDDV